MTAVVRNRIPSAATTPFCAWLLLMLVASGPVTGAPFAFITNQGSHPLAVIDLEHGHAVATVDPGEGPAGVAESRDGCHIFVSDPKTGKVCRIDGATNRIIAYGAAIAPDGAHVFVTNQQDNSVSIIDTADLAVIAQPEVGEFPEGIVVDTFGERIYVASWFSNELLVLDSRNLQLIETFPTGDGPRALGVFVTGGR